MFNNRDKSFVKIAGVTALLLSLYVIMLKSQINGSRNIKVNSKFDNLYLTATTFSPTTSLNGVTAVETVEHANGLTNSKEGESESSPTGSSKNKMKTLVLQVDNRDFDGVSYWSLSQCINTAYASAHGYVYKRVNSFETCLKQHEIAPAWCKVLAILDALKSGEYETILYLDSDAYVRNFSISVDDFLERWGRRDPGGQGPVVHAADDCCGQFANTGQMIVEKSPISLTLVEKWWELKYDFPNRQWDQRGFAELVRNNDTFKTSVNVIPTGEDSWYIGYRKIKFDSKYKESNWINHIPSNGYWRNERVPLMSKFIEEHGFIDCPNLTRG
uniref:Nucleotide-diphospho-sugar transferase domain-containing protein n=1 Tax=Aplanochytrium stocchinoi TaxID=215587 RepID=A0A7S3PH72_9STRA|mmetsp:Transcript_11999/g.15634  ORF Transcript_11999/g.15634 Transcript_11999/m.15634 type:complete len:329 (+) Transcript_11999:51-1037(+)